MHPNEVYMRNTYGDNSKRWPKDPIMEVPITAAELEEINDDFIDGRPIDINRWAALIQTAKLVVMPDAD